MKYTLTAEQFETAKKNATDFKEESLIAAFAVMVEGMPVSKACEVYKLSKQNLYRILRDVQALGSGVTPPSRVKQKIDRKKSRKEIPSDWVWVSVCLPPAMALDVEKLGKAAIDSLPTAAENASGANNENC